MGINVEFTCDLALRNIAEFTSGRRKSDECIPASLEKGRTYPFLKKGQRNYWFGGEVPLLETKGDQQLSRPKASVLLVDATHFIEHGEVWTKGHYSVVEVFTDDTIHFESYFRVGKWVD